jgi:hypothetical protein
MRQAQTIGGGMLLACVLALSGAAAAQDDTTVAKAVAQKQSKEIHAGDPARWRSDDAGRQAAMKTLQKEIGAAYDEAKRACAKGAAAERSACLQAARQTWQQDMKHAPSQLASAKDMGSVTTVTTTTTGTGSNASSSTTVDTTGANAATR